MVKVTSLTCGAQCADLREDLFATGLDQACKNAGLSALYLDSMKRHHIQLRFSEVPDNGVWVADTTCNPTNAYKVRGALVSADLVKADGQTTRPAWLRVFNR